MLAHTCAKVSIVTPGIVCRISCSTVHCDKIRYFTIPTPGVSHEPQAGVCRLLRLLGKSRACRILNSSEDIEYIPLRQVANGEGAAEKTLVSSCPISPFSLCHPLFRGPQDAHRGKPLGFPLSYAYGTYMTTYRRTIKRDKDRYVDIVLPYYVPWKGAFE